MAFEKLRENIYDNSYDGVSAVATVLKALLAEVAPLVASAFAMLIALSLGVSVVATVLSIDVSSASQDYIAFSKAFAMVAACFFGCAAVKLAPCVYVGSKRILKEMLNIT